MKKGIVCGLLVVLCVVLFAVNLAKGSIDIPPMLVGHTRSYLLFFLSFNIVQPSTVLCNVARTAPAPLFMLSKAATTAP